MFEAGIVDPTKVTRSALQNAASIAALMLTTEAMITNIKEDEEKGAAAGRGVGAIIPCIGTTGNSVRAFRGRLDIWPPKLTR